MDFLHYPLNPWATATFLFLLFIACYWWLNKYYFKTTTTEMLPHTIVKDWEPTGRIDICFPNLVGGLNQDNDENPTVCQLMCEDRRTVTSMTESEHLEIRWRRATPKEARDLVILYHKAKVEK